MFTSRAEYRLLLRQDNADMRLLEYGYQAGLVSEAERDAFAKRKRAIEDDLKKLRETRIGNDTLYHYLKRPEASYKALTDNKIHLSKLDDNEAHYLETEIKYEGYIARQMIEVKNFKKVEKRKIPDEVDYDTVNGIGREAKEKLKQIKPDSIGQASRIPGISSCDLSLLAVHVARLASKK
jgi:tRNA uridine 5-carboxymethylaminomethyl modification enzyme